MNIITISKFRLQKKCDGTRKSLNLLKKRFSVVVIQVMYVGGKEKTQKTNEIFLL